MPRRWLYHALSARSDSGADPYAPASLQAEGFVHCSFAPTLSESIALYFAGCDDVEVWRIDPHALGIDVADTPRGPMPHVRGPIPRGAIRARWSLADLPTQLDDEVDGAL